MVGPTGQNLLQGHMKERKRENKGGNVFQRYSKHVKRLNEFGINISSLEQREGEDGERESRHGEREGGRSATCFNYNSLSLVYK